jgi:hypothetical protein
MLVVFVDAVHDMARTRPYMDQWEMLWRKGGPTIQTRGTAASQLGWAVVGGGFVVGLPLLGAYVSRAKKREIPEGYVLVTFFGPIGLIVALCLPSNPQGP